MKTCPFCQTPTSDDAAFCAQCGKALNPVQAPPSPSATVSPYAPPSPSATVSPYAPPSDVQPIQPAPTYSQPVQTPVEPAWNAAPAATEQPVQPVYQPATPMPGWDAPIGESSGKSPAFRVIGISAAVLVLVGIVSAAFMLLSSNPQSKASSAVEKTQKAIETQLNTVGKAMGGDILAQMEEKPSLTELRAELPDAIPYMPSGQWVSIKSYADPKNDLIHMQLDNSLNVGADLFSDSDNITLDAPDFLPYPIAFSYKTLEEKISDGTLTDILNPSYSSYDDYYYDWNAYSSFGNSSKLFGKAAYSDSDELSALMVPMAGLVSNGPAASLFSGLNSLYSGINYEKYEKKFIEASEKLEESAEYQDPKKTTYPGISGNVESITVTYPDDAVDDYIEDCIDIYMDMMDEIDPSLIGGTMPRIPTISASDFTKTIYIQSGYACAYELEIRLRAEGESMNMSLTIQTEDGKNPLNDWSAQIVAKASGQVLLNCTVEGSGGYDEKKGLDYTLELSASAAYGSTERIVLEMQYNPTSSDENITISVRESSGMRFSVTGTLKTEKSAVTFSLNQFSYDAGYMGSGRYDVDASLRVEITNGYQGKKAPSGAEDGFDLTMGDWNRILEDVEDRLERKVGSFFY